MNRRNPSAGVADARNLDLIREDIARTRQELGETVEALSARMDVKTRARQQMLLARARAAAGARSGAVQMAQPVSIVVAVVAVGAVVALVVLRRRQWL